MPNPSLIEIDLAAVRENVRAIDRLVGPRAGVCAVVKADGYGLGARHVARAAVRGGARMLAVYTADQAIDLLESEPLAVPVLVLMPYASPHGVPALRPWIDAGRVQIVVHDADQVRAAIALARRAVAPVPVHLEVDTGLTRGGCAVEAAPDLLRTLLAAPRVRLAGIATQFASADGDPAFTRQQHDRLESVLGAVRHALPPGVIVHEANTAATLRQPDYHRDMVRVGQGWAALGAARAVAEGNAAGTTLVGCLRWTSRIVGVKPVPAGTNVGYAGSHRTARATTIALVPVGYADGLPRNAHGGGARPPARVGLLVEGASTSRVHAAVVGVVNMDQSTLDLGDLVDDDGRPVDPETAARVAERVRVGQAVELVGRRPAGPNGVETLAAAAGTNALEIFCRLSHRLRRVHHESGEGGAEPRPLVELERAPSTMAS